METGILYIVATPIGNLEDITFRAVDTLKLVDSILAEDTRITSNLLKHYDIFKPTLRYDQHSSVNIKLKILNMLNQGKSLALVSDAGTPGISDPGNELVNFIYENNPEIRAIPIPGPSSISAAASVSGFKMGKFMFIGYLPKKKKTRTLKLISNAKTPVMYLDSPKRLVSNLNLILENIGDREVVILREMTKVHEEIIRGSISKCLEILHKSDTKGELVVVVNHK